MHKILSAFLVASCILLSTAQAEIKIGWIGPLTGNAAILGTDTIPSIQMVFDKINSTGGIQGEQLKLVIEDDQYETNKTVSAYNRLVHAEGIKVLFVLTYGGLFTLAPRAQEDGVLLLDSLDCDEAIAKLPSNTICVAKSTEALGAMVAQQIIKRGEAPPAIVYFNGDPFMGTTTSSTIAELKKHGITPTYIDTYDNSTSDFRTMLLKIRALKETGSLAFFGYDQLGLAVKQARALGMKQQIHGVNTVTSPGFLSLAGTAADGILGAAFSAERTPEYLEYAAEFKKRVGREPQFETSAVPSYDVANLLVKSLYSNGYELNSKTVNPIAIRDFLLKTREYKGLSGDITIDPDGATRSIRVTPMILKNGAFTPLSQ